MKNYRLDWCKGFVYLFVSKKHVNSNNFILQPQQIILNHHLCVCARNSILQISPFTTSQDSVVIPQLFTVLLLDQKSSSPCIICIMIFQQNIWYKYPPEKKNTSNEFQQWKLRWIPLKTNHIYYIYIYILCHLCFPTLIPFHTFHPKKIDICIFFPRDKLAKCWALKSAAFRPTGRPVTWSCRDRGISQTTSDLRSHDS